MDQPRLLYVTTENRAEARAIGELLLNRDLCACVNILDGMESMYRWKGAIQTDTECVLLVKTTADLVQPVTTAILKHHSYDVPCVISLPLSESEGNKDYLQWIQNSVNHTNN